MTKTRPDDFEEIVRLHDEIPFKGNLKWKVNPENKYIALVSAETGEVVLGFSRWGQTGIAPKFYGTINEVGGMGLRRADDFFVVENNQVTEINNPISRYIENSHSHIQTLLEYVHDLEDLTQLKDDEIDHLIEENDNLLESITSNESESDKLFGEIENLKSRLYFAENIGFWEFVFGRIKSKFSFLKRRTGEEFS